MAGSAGNPFGVPPATVSVNVTLSPIVIMLRSREAVKVAADRLNAVSAKAKVHQIAGARPRGRMDPSPSDLRSCNRFTIISFQYSLADGLPAGQASSAL